MTPAEAAQAIEAHTLLSDEDNLLIKEGLRLVALFLRHNLCPVEAGTWPQGHTPHFKAVNYEPLNPAAHNLSADDVTSLAERLQRRRLALL